MIHYQLIGAVRDHYIEKNKVELKKDLSFWYTTDCD